MGYTEMYIHNFFQKFLKTFLICFHGAFTSSVIAPDIPPTDTVWRGDFSDRLLLLSGTRAGGTTMSALGLVLSGVGLLDDLVLFAVRRVALAVFHSADAAAALLQEPTASWIAMGFEDCRRALDAEDAAVTANEVHLLLLVVQGLGPAFLG